MDETIALDEAKAMASLLPALIRQLFAVDDDLAAELPLAQLRVCSILYDGPQRMSALGRELGVSLSAMTQIADRLERARLVKRVTEGSDRRIRCLQLTERGEKIMRQREAARIQRVSAMLEHLSPQARKGALDTLKMLLKACVTSNGAVSLATGGTN